MTRIILLLLTLGIGVAAHADVSDSGNLTIGGTGVIQGTMTVQGNAFSVGGTTFSVAGGSVTLGGRLNAAAAGIKWADGTTSTTSAAGTAGGVFGISSHMISSAAITGASGVTFAVSGSTGGNVVFVSSRTYTIKFGFKQNSAYGGVSLRFNNDAGTHYGYHYGGFVVGTSNDGGGAESGDVGMYLYKATYPTPVGKFNFGEIHFRTTPTDTSQIMLYGTMLAGYNYASGYIYPITFGGIWTSGGPQDVLNAVSIYASGGNWTGYAELWEDAQ